MTYEQQPPDSPGGNPPGSEPQLPEAEQHEDQADDQPRIWAGSLVDYNNGILHGAWIDAARNPEAIQVDIDIMLAASPWSSQTGEPAEEWGVFDTDNFSACQIGQHESLDHRF
jgi:antirestriction protein